MALRGVRVLSGGKGMKISYLFPGQGAQYAGMGKDLYDGSSSARKVFEDANDILGFDIAKLCFCGPHQQLTQTAMCQPAIFVTGIASLRAFEQLTVNSQLSTGCAMAGLSLGEITALCAAGSIAFKDALCLVKARGEFMEEASHKNPGKMLAIMGLDRQKVERICALSGASIANLNTPEQVVISGRPEDIDKAQILSKREGARHTILLKVSGAFHSPLMEGASQRFGTLLSSIKICKPGVPVISNVTAAYEDGPESIRTNLRDQLSSTTLWEDSMRALLQGGITKFIEFAPGQVLSKMLHKIEPDVSVYNVETMNDICKIIELLSQG